MKKLELLAPVGDFERLETAIYFGADAVYFAGKKYGLRAFSTNFDEDEISKAVEYAHTHNVKVYITVNILAHNTDLIGLVDYLKYLENSGVDAVIVSDLGIASMVKAHTNLELHVSTQANVTNVEAAKMWVKLGAKRLVLARELNVKEIKEIAGAVGDDIDIECFCHGAMCISYSGRCLLSNYFTGRDSNKGACAQPCRWGYSLHSEYDQKKVEGYFPILEDSRGTYILNSRDMCLVEHIKELAEAGISSFKIEGRMKTPYYVATTVNAYRRAIDNYVNGNEDNFDYVKELEKSSHREFTTGFYFDSDQKTNGSSATPVQDFDFTAIVLEDAKDGKVKIQARNKFIKGDELEVLTPHSNFNQLIKVEEMVNEKSEIIEVANKPMEIIHLSTTLPLHKNDILRKKK